jgi:GT2 family glycosyltransferase
LKPDQDLPTDIVYTLLDRDGKLDSFQVVSTTMFETQIDYIVQNAGSEIYSPYSAGDRNFGWLASKVSNSQKGARRAWCGAAVLLPRNYFEQVGFFDESFFLYYEDTEYASRALKHGLPPNLIPELRVFHRHSGITRNYEDLRAKSIWKSRQIFAIRTSGYIYSVFFLVLLTSKATAKLLLKKTTFKHFVRFLLPEISYSLIGLLSSISLKSKIRGYRSK